MVVVTSRRKCWLWFPIRFTKYEVVEKYDDLDKFYQNNKEKIWEEIRRQEKGRTEC